MSLVWLCYQKETDGIHFGSSQSPEAVSKSCAEIEGKKKDACRWFLKGKCALGDMCLKTHDEVMKRRKGVEAIAKIDEANGASEASASRVKGGGKQSKSKIAAP